MPVFARTTVYTDPEMSNCLLVGGPNGELVRLVPSESPMDDYYTAHFLEGSLPATFTGRSPTGVYVGIPWRTKEEHVALLQAEWGK
jgi:hypothetical protein